VLVVTSAAPSASKPAQTSSPGASAPTSSTSSNLTEAPTTRLPNTPPAAPETANSAPSSYGDPSSASRPQAFRDVPQLPTPQPTAKSAPIEPVAQSTNESPENEPPAPPPVIRISAPTAGARVTVTAPSMTLAGLASHASGIRAVEWMTDKGDSGVAEGTSRWSISALSIKPGTTTVTVTAVSVSGDMTNAALTVVRAEPLPKLSIAFPTADSHWTTGTATVALRGTATDNVTQVTWSSDSGSSGVATDTGTWAIASIGLREGINKITLTGQDASGRTDRHVLTVTYRPRMVSTAGVTK
jgi:hypothetical protein